MMRTTRQPVLPLAGRVGIIVVASVGLAACSTSADRFGPFDSGGSADYGQTSALPSGANAQMAGYRDDVSSAPLDSAPRYRPVQSHQQANSYQPSNSYQPDRSYRSAEPAGARQGMPRAGAGGTVVVQPGDTLYSLSRTHGVAVNDLIATNGISPPYSIQAGQRLRLPGGAAAPTVSARASGGGSVHHVQPGETLYSISRRNGFTPEVVAQHNGIEPPYTLRIGQRLRIPGGGGDSAGTRVASVPRPEVNPQQSAQDSYSQPAPAQRAAYRGPLPQPTARAASTFRWPVKGRIISRFGTRSSGARNDGINIAVPEGTSVKAAENGVVAYAGNELKGFGNLVLIRHADNWVTAYAHNRNLLVQRGDRVNRGQIIARAGQTGSVNSPQVHFEIRQGARAIDPLSQLDRSQFAGG